MKSVLFILILLPQIAGAQTTKETVYPNYKKTKVHYRKMVVHWGETIYNDKHYHAESREDNPGDLRFSKTNPPGNPKVDFVDITDAANLGVWTINDPEISGGGKCDLLKGDLLILNHKDQVGTLTGHIRTINKGKEKEVGSVALLDFSGDRYKVICIK